jgi:carbonic anhydrase/acetyltransferase-like protein (isoleucine patch superfamily)
MIYELEDRKVTIEGECFVAPTAVVIGSVILKNNASVWWNAVIRGDTDLITIGEDSNIQDGAVLHTDPGIELVLGRGVTVGHKAMVHGCTIGDYTLVGINSVILNRAKIGRGCIIGANALVTEGKEIPDYSVVMGSPGKVVKTLTPEAAALLERQAANYVFNAKRYLANLRPDPRFLP